MAEAAYEFPSGGGRMGASIRNLDWSGTPIGPIAQWPAALLSIVQMMLSQKHAICMVWGPQLTFLYNDSYAPILGAKEPDALGQPFKQLWSDVWSDIEPFVDQAMSGEGTWAEELPLIMTRNGFPEETYWSFSYSPLFDGGTIKGMINVALDATPAVIARRNAETLQRELVHRVKNTLAVTSAVVSSTLRNAKTIEEARATVIERIGALGRAQELLHSADDGSDISEIISMAMQAHLDRPTRLALDGPNIKLVSQQAVGLSLAIYELATNAVKYGALSGEKGQVHIGWDAHEDGTFKFTWQESGGPEVSHPSRTGFGSRLTNTIVAAYFSGTGETRYHPQGVRFELTGTVKTASD